MKVYCQEGNVHQAQELYEEMKKVFHEELRSSVPVEIDELFRQGRQQGNQPYKVELPQADPDYWPGKGIAAGPADCGRISPGRQQ